MNQFIMPECFMDGALIAAPLTEFSSANASWFFREVLLPLDLPNWGVMQRRGGITIQGEF
jgi:hypothetical protein